MKYFYAIYLTAFSTDEKKNSRDVDKKPEHQPILIHDKAFKTFLLNYYLIKSLQHL